MNQLKKVLKLHSKITRRDVELSLKVDTSVIGGIKVSIGERLLMVYFHQISDIKTVLEGR